MASTFRPVDSKREEFRKYVECNGIMGALTKALVMLYEEEDKPEYGLEYFRKVLSEVPYSDELLLLRAENDNLKHKLIQMEAERNSLQERLLKYEPSMSSYLHKSPKSKGEQYSVSSPSIDHSINSSNE